MARLYLETLNVFQFRAFTPNSLHHLHGTNCILASNGEGKFSCLDIVSGDELCAKDVPHRGPGGAMLTLVHPRTTKLVVVSGGVMGARGMVEGGILLDTILQVPARENSSLVTMEIPLVQVPILMKELRMQSLSVDSELLSSILDQLEAKLADRANSKSSPKWSTVLFEGPVLKLYELFEDIFVKMKGSTTQGPAEAGSEPQVSIPASSPALPVISAIRLRLLLLKPEEKLHRLELGGTLEPDDVKLMFCEAMRRLSLQKWPHKDYVWAVPRTMAAAGFYHLPNIQSNAAHSQGDRTSCFLCHIYLYGWEKTDEPWSEHERHSPLCPFVHGESTENVSVAVTEGTHPAVVCVAGEEDCITCISTTSNTDLVAVGTKQGRITVWDVNRVLFIMECTSLDVSVQLLDACLSSASRSCQDVGDNQPINNNTIGNCAPLNKDTAPLGQAPSTPTQSFMITSLCLLGSPSSTLLPPRAAIEGQSVLLVAGVTLRLEDNSTLPVLLLHSFKQQLAGADPKQGGSPQYPPSSYISVLSSSDHHPAETNLHAPHSGSPSQSMLDLTSMYLPPTSLSSIENILEDKGEEFAVPGGGGGGGEGDTSLPQCAETQTLNIIPLVCFASSSDESPFEVQSIVPLSGGHLLGVHVRCSKGTGEHPCGGLYVYPITASDGGQVVLGETPVSTLKFTREDEAISLCAACGLDDPLQGPRDLIASVTRGGSVVVYGTDLVKVVERAPSSPDDPYTCVCTRTEQLVAVRRSGLMEVLRMVSAPESEVTPLDAPVDASTVLPTPEQLETFSQLTQCSPRSVPFYACAPVGWLEIPLLQYMRRSLAHVVYESPGGGQEELPHTRIWKYQNGANEKGLRSSHFFELTVDHISSRIGCVSVQFNFADPQSLSSKGRVTLLRPSQLHSHWSASSFSSGKTPPGGPPDSVCLCGPVGVKQFLDITNHSVRINFCHPDLLCGQFTTLWLLIEDLFSDDCSRNGSRSSFSSTVAAAAARPVSPSSASRRLVNAMRQRQKLAQAKVPSSVEQGILLVSLYPPAESSPASSVQLGHLVRVLESPHYLMHLVLVACSYRVQRDEYEKLPRSLQARVDGIEERDPLLLNESKLRALDLLCWAGSLHSWRRGSKPVQDAVLPLALSLLYSCYIAGGRKLAHKCSRLIVALCRDTGDGDGVENPCRAEFLRSLCALLPFILQCTSAACVHWLLRMLASLSVGQHESNATIATCLKSLVDMTRALKEKNSLNTQLLHTYFHQDGYVFEPELFDVYLSYSHKGPSKSAQKVATATEQHTQVPPSSSSAGPSQTSTPVSKPSPVDKPSHTIYDAELELLLEPLPTEGTKPVGGRKSTSLKDPMGIFKHGSFLLYGQRGLLETHPLEYTCLSISGGAMVEEGHLHSFGGPTSASSSLPTQPQFPEPLKAVGYHFPPMASTRKLETAAPSATPAGAGSGDASNTSKQVPALLLTPLVLPKELFMSIESLKSGVSYLAVLKFAQQVELTDFSIPSTEFMSSVTVDVWLDEDGEEGAVRVAHSSEIMDKSLMLGNLMPPPLCQFVKVSFVGKLGASREKVQVFLGAFYGHPATPGGGNGEALSPVTLKSLESKMLTEYYHAREKLVSSLAQYTSVVNKSSDPTLLKQHEDAVTASSHACFRLQVRLSRLRNFVRQYQATTGGWWVGQGRVFELKEEVRRALLVDVSSSQLCKTIGCLVDSVLVLSLSLASSKPTGKESGDGPSPAAPPAPPPSYLSEEECSVLFMTLCVQGIPKLHARSCALLVALCGSQSWWGCFVTSAVATLYSSSQTTIFHKERALLQLSALCQRTCASSDVMQCLLELLRSKLSCLLDKSGTGGGSRQLDQQLVQWLLLLLSHSLSSLTPSQHGNLFSPSLDSASPPRSSQLTSELQHQQQGAEGAAKPGPAAAASTTALSRGDWRSILRDLSELKRVTRRSSAVPKLLEVIVAEGAVPEPPLQVLTSSPVQVLPFSVSPEMCISMTKGLVEFILLLIESSSCHFVPIACKALTHVLRLSGTVPPLSSVVTQRQLDQLLFFLCQKSQLLMGAQDQGSLKWSICSIEWLVVSLVCQGLGYAQQLQQQQAQTLLSTIRKASGSMEGVLLGGEDEKSEAKPKSYAKATSAGEGSSECAANIPQFGSTKLLASLAKAMKKAEVHLGPHNSEYAELLQEATDDVQMYVALLSADAGKMTDEVGVADGALLQEGDLTQEQEVSKDEGQTTDTSDAGVKSDDTLSEEAQVVPEWKPKQKKKLSRQHSTSGMKYAPGDYTEVPSFAAPPVNSVVDFEQLPYASFIISGAVDSRLVTSLELTAELELQCTARRVYESVLWALALAKPLAAATPSSPPQRAKPAVASSGCLDPANGAEATEMLLRAIECTLERARSSCCKLDIVPLLELWVWLNSLDWHSSGASDFQKSGTVSQKEEAARAESAPSQQLKGGGMTLTLDVFSGSTLGLLMDLVLGAVNLNRNMRLCHLVVALFHSVLRHLKAQAGGSTSFDFVVDVQKFSDLLVKLCSDWPECSTGEGPVLVSFFTDLLFVKVVDCGGRKEPQGGILLLLDILSVIMEDRENVAIQSSALFRLVEVLGSQQHLKLLWNASDQSSHHHHHTLSTLRRLCASVMDLLSYSVTLTDECNATLHVAELDEDRRKYRYLTVAHVSQELKWAQVPLQTGTGSKLISELLRLLHQALSSPLPNSVIVCLSEFCRKEFPAEDTTADVDPVQVADATKPLLSLVYSNTAQLTSLLYLLNSTDGPLQEGVAGSSVQDLFLSFIDFLQDHCADPTCFFKPILDILCSLHSPHSDITVSKPFVRFVGKLMADTQKPGTSRQLLRFIEQGGAKCVFDCFVSTCRQSQLLPGRPLDHSISSLGSRETFKPFREGSKLIDILPLASVKLTPCRTNIRDLQNCAHSNYPSRSSTFHHVFNPGEEWLKMDISLHFPVLLHTVQLFQTQGSQFSGPSVIQISCASRPGSSPVLPVTPLVDTTRFPCIRLELLHPVVAQQVVVMMKRPMVSNIISLSHMHVLALEYGSSVGVATGRSSGEAVQDSLHPCAGWLSIVYHWVRQDGEITEKVLSVAEHHPELLSSCFSLLQNVNSLDYKTILRLQRFILVMVYRSPDLGIAAIQHLLGFPSVASVDSKDSLPQASSLVVNSVSTSLLHQLFQLKDEHVTSRLHMSLKLLYSLLSPAHKELANQLPPFIRVLAGAVWFTKDPTMPFDTELFRSFVDATLSLDLNGSLRSSLESLLCAMCRHSSDLFTLVIDRCQLAVKEEKPEMCSLLHMLAHMAKSEDRIKDLLSSELTRNLVSWLHITFVTLRDKTLTNGTGISEEDVRPLLSKASAYLAFFTDLSRSCDPVQKWLGSSENVEFWYPMTELLSLEPPFVSAFDISFCHDVTLGFFSACLLDQWNKLLFTRLLCRILRGAYSRKETESGRAQKGHAGVPVLTTFIYKLIVNLVLKEECRTVVIELDGSGLGDQQQLPSLSLTKTTDAQEFHPSFPIGEHAYCVQLQSSCSLQQLERLCAKSGDMAPPSSSAKKVPSEQSSQPWLAWDHNLRKFDLQCWKSGMESNLAASEPNGSIKSKSLSLLFATQTRLTFLQPLTLIAQLTKTNGSMMAGGQLHLVAFVDRGQPMNCDISSAQELCNTVDPNLLDLFIQCGGLETLAECLPALYSHNWPEPVGFKEEEKGEEERTSLATNHFKPHALLHLMPHILFHSVLMLGLCLKINCFCRSLRDNLSVSTVLLRMLLGAELTGTLAKTVQQEFSFLPYLVFHKVLVTYPSSTERGHSLRLSAFAAGVVHHTLFCLSVSGHHNPRVAEKDVTTREFAVVSALETSCTAARVTVSTDKHYWAKGTGFSTGSTASKWNMDATLARQRSGEKFVYVCFAILAEYVGVGEGHTAHCTQDLCDIFTTSCLLPAMASYLLNDSVLDISKHIPLYNSLLELLFCLASNESLRHLLMLPVYSDTTTVSSDGNCLSSLLAKLGTLAKTYQKTAGVETTTAIITEGSSQPTTSSGGSEPDASFMRLLQTNTNASSTELPSNEESSLNELVSKIIVTDGKVAKVVKAMQAEQISPPQRPGEEQTVEDSFSLYMKLIKPLQFRSYQMTEEDDSGRIRFKVPFFFDSRVQSSLSSSSSSSAAATRARRLAQEVATLSTSLPLSPSSSVFVCCDEERLDVMKVLITGPSETPYANGCFEFDVYFPPEYPRVPMMVNLMTTGQGRVRFNPNLYNDGKVCLSVLNTWHGSPEEKWNAQTSSFLQVLVSIQSLILVPEPFFNEPGYEQYRGTGYGNLKSLAYSANICTATVQWAMINQLRNPSPCFKEVILQHFYLRQPEVLEQCEQWKSAIMKGIQMQTSGFELKEHLQNLTSCVDTLRTELSKLCPSDNETYLIEPVAPPGAHPSN